MRSRSIVAIIGVAIIGTIATCQMQNAASSNPSSESGEVKVFPKEAVMTSFAKGGTLVAASNYKVMTAQRSEDGGVEVHTKFTDVFYIVQGGTTIITGGKVIGEKFTNPEEPRGISIEGGDTHELAAGDVIVIPAGVPHWMRDVKGTMLYFVVKVQEAAK